MEKIVTTVYLKDDLFMEPDSELHIYELSDHTAFGSHMYMQGICKWYPKEACDDFCHAVGNTRQ